MLFPLIYFHLISRLTSGLLIILWFLIACRGNEEELSLAIVLHLSLSSIPEILLEVTTAPGPDRLKVFIICNHGYLSSYMM